MIIEEIQSFIEKCPYLKKFMNCNVPKVSVDQLADRDDAIQYTIQITPSEQIISEMIDGSSIRRCTFDLVSKEFLDIETLQNIENNGFYETFSLWLEEQSMEGLLPENWQDIRATSNGYLYNEIDATSAIYRVGVELIYYYERKNKEAIN